MKHLLSLGILLGICGSASANDYDVVQVGSIQLDVKPFTYLSEDGEIALVPFSGLTSGANISLMLKEAFTGDIKLYNTYSELFKAAEFTTKKGNKFRGWIFKTKFGGDPKSPPMAVFVSDTKFDGKYPIFFAKDHNDDWHFAFWAVRAESVFGEKTTTSNYSPVPTASATVPQTYYSTTQTQTRGFFRHRRFR